MTRKVAVVTDSSAMLPRSEHPGIEVVPLQVIIDDQAYDEGDPEATPEAVAAALTDRRAVSTSRTAPGVLTDKYAELADAGYDEIVSIHLSSEMSGTVESARLAARSAAVPVVVVDTRTVGPCLGYAVAAAVRSVEVGASAAEAGEAALARTAEIRSYFYVHTLEHLRRGGRIGAAAAVLGSALAVKPLLGIDDGRVELTERVRTSARALQRLHDLAVERAHELGDRPVEITVAHLDAPERAQLLVETLASQLASQLGDRPVSSGEIAAALGVHVGPGMLAVVVAPAL